MSKKGLIATATGLLFVAAYVFATVTFYGMIPRLHWTLEALYWGVAGIVWVFPVTKLMYWAAGKL